MKKPEFLSPRNAAAFDDADVASAYRHRVPYPPATFDILVQLIDPGCRVVLDVGCGEGALARPLAPRVDRVDAVDPAAPMLAVGERAPGGDHPSIRWILGRAEDVELKEPYGLVCAGASLHWMDWEVVMPRFASVLTPVGQLAIVESDDSTVAWRDELLRLIRTYSVNPDWGGTNFDLAAELEARDLFRLTGRQVLSGPEFVQPVNDWIESLHSHGSLSRARLGPAATRAFDDAARDLAAGDGGVVRREARTTVVWGRPRNRSA